MRGPVLHERVNCQSVEDETKHRGGVENADIVLTSTGREGFSGCVMVEFSGPTW